MSDRAYRLIFGALLLLSLSFDLNYVIYGGFKFEVQPPVLMWCSASPCQRIPHKAI